MEKTEQSLEQLNDKTEELTALLERIEALEEAVQLINYRSIRRL